jgi:hypothetical protein
MSDDPVDVILTSVLHRAGWTNGQRRIRAEGADISGGSDGSCRASRRPWDARGWALEMGDEFELDLVYQLLVCGSCCRHIEQPEIEEGIERPDVVSASSQITKTI